jgi:hypothetical protein
MAAVSAMPRAASWIERHALQRNGKVRRPRGWVERQGNSGPDPEFLEKLNDRRPAKAGIPVNEVG